MPNGYFVLIWSLLFSKDFIAGAATVYLCVSLNSFYQNWFFPVKFEFLLSDLKLWYKVSDLNGMSNKYWSVNVLSCEFNLYKPKG